jgi:hypothetical protein
VCCVRQIKTNPAVLCELPARVLVVTAPADGKHHHSHKVVRSESIDRCEMRADRCACLGWLACSLAQVDFVFRLFACDGTADEPAAGSAHALVCPHWLSTLKARSVTGAWLSAANRGGIAFAQALDEAGARVQLTGHTQDRFSIDLLC